MWGTLLCGLVLLLILWDYLNKKHRYEVLKKSKITGPQALPIIGTIYKMRGSTNENVIERLRTIAKLSKNFHMWVFHQLNVFCTDIRVMEALLSSPTHITKNMVYDMLSAWLGDGLLMSTGKKWHTRRKIITPAFHFNILEDFIDIFDRQSNVAVEKLKAREEYRKQQAIDIFPVVCLCALDIIAESAMGVQVEAQLNPSMGYVKSVQLVTDLMANRLRKPLWRLDTLFKILAPQKYDEMMKHIGLMHKFTRNVIEQRREQLIKIANKDSSEKTIQSIDEDKLNASKKQMGLLDILLQASVDGKPLSNDDILEEVETFMFEGHDTTTSGASFALYLISRHPEVQQKIFAEIKEVLGEDRTSKASLKQLQNMKYLECVIKESMRLYPPVPVIGRYFDQDVDLNGTVIPAKTHLNFLLFIILRDPDYFKQPNDFLPERFSADNGDDIHPFAYTPFSAGPRNCIGQKYAMLEMKSLISKILRNFQLFPLGQDIIPTLSLILRSVTGMQMGLKERVY